MEKKFRLNHTVFWIPMIFIFGMTAVSYFLPEVFATAMNSSFTWIASHMAWFFQIVSGLTVTIVFIIALSKGGEIRFGGKDAKPEFSNWTWFSMIIAGGIGVGVVLWGVAEPIYNFSTPPKVAGVEAFSEGAAVWGLAHSFMHFGITPYAFYTIFGLAIGLAHYNYGQPLRTSSGFHFIWGAKRSEFFNDLVDMISVIALSSGLAVSMGLGVLQIARGLETVFGIAPSNMIWFIIIIAIVASYTISSYVGLDRSLQFIARYNVNIFLFSLLFLIVVGPTAFMFNLGVQSFGDYITNFVSRTLWTSPISQEDYLIWWDIFFWTVWCAYATVLGLFLARISYGRTLRSFILCNLFLPSLFAIVWFTVYGGTAIKFQIDGVVDLWGVISDRGIEAAVFTFFHSLPLGAIISPLFILVVILSFVTIADPMTSAIATLSCRFDDTSYGGEPPKFLKLIWGIGIGSVALVMIIFAGFDGPRMLSTIMGMPGMLMAFLLFVSLIKGVWFPKEEWLKDSQFFKAENEVPFVHHEHAAAEKID